MKSKRKDIQALSKLFSLPVYENLEECDISILPETCQEELNGKEHQNCLDFHQGLAQEASHKNGSLFRECPHHLTCFALRTSSGVIQGGHVPHEQSDQLATLGKMLHSYINQPVTTLQNITRKQLINPNFELSKALEALATGIGNLGNYNYVAILKTPTDNEPLQLGSNFLIHPELSRSALNEIVQLTIESAPNKIQPLDQETTLALLPAHVSNPKGYLYPLSGAQHEKNQAALLIIQEQETPLEDSELFRYFGTVTHQIFTILNHYYYRQHLEQLKSSRRRLESHFNKLGSALAHSLELDELLKIILEQSIDLLETDGGTIFLHQEGQLSKEISINREVQKNSATTLWFPLYRKGEVKAYLQLFSLKERLFRHAEIGWLRDFSHQAALAIENAQVFEQEQAKAKEATALYQAARTIEEEEELEPLLNQASHVFSLIGQVDRAILFIQTSEHQYNLASSTGIAEDQKLFLRAFTFYFDRINQDLQKLLLENQPLVFHKLPEHDDDVRKLCAMISAESCIIVPLLTQEELQGFLLLDSSSGRHMFSQATIRRLMTLALQLANAIFRIKLIQELQENLNAVRSLYQVSTTIIETLSLPEVLERVIHEVAHIAPESAYALTVVDSNNSFHYKTSIGLPEELNSPLIQLTIAQDALDQNTFAFKQLNKPNQQLTNEEHLVLQSGFGTMITIPLISQSKTIGVLACFFRLGTVVRQRDLQLIQGFANHCSAAIENARLHGIVTQQKSEAETLFEINQTLNQSLELQDVFCTISNKLVQASQSDACSIFLLERHHLVRKYHIGEKVRFGEGYLDKDEAPDFSDETQPYLFLLPHEQPESLQQERFETVIILPFSSHGTVLGYAYLYFLELPTMNQNTESFLQALSHQAGVVISNARLYQEKEKATSLLYEALLPHEDLSFQGTRVGHKYVPSQELSGDYYDVFSLSPSKLGIVIADVSGKGTDAAMQTVRAKFIIESFLQDGLSPAETLTFLNKNVANKEGMAAKPLTVFLGIINLEHKTLTYTSAGHEPTIIWSSQAPPAELESNGIIIGALDDFTYEDQTVEIDNGTYLMLYTDGVSEARNQEGELFEANRIMEVITTTPQGSDPQVYVDKLYNTIQEYTGNQLADDFSLLCLTLT